MTAIPRFQVLRALLVTATTTVFGFMSLHATVPIDPAGSPFGDRVWVFDSSMDMEQVQVKLDALHEQQAHNQFGEERYAVLFKPGTYELDVTVDYYVQALGLGRVPGDVVIEGAVQSTTTTRRNNVTVMFWRAAENFEVRPKDPKEPVVWAVSQAAPYRRMHIRGDVIFDKGGWQVVDILRTRWWTAWLERRQGSSGSTGTVSWDLGSGATGMRLLLEWQVHLKKTGRRRE